MQELEQAIRERAYHLWTANGRQEGDAEAHWLTAQREILASSLGTLSRHRTAPRRSRRGHHQRRCELHSGRRMLAVELGEAVAVSTQRRLFHACRVGGAGFSLDLAGAATSKLSLTGRWFRGAAEGIGRANRVAHRRSHCL